MCGVIEKYWRTTRYHADLSTYAQDAIKEVMERETSLVLQRLQDEKLQDEALFLCDSPQEFQTPVCLREIGSSAH